MKRFVITLTALTAATSLVACSNKEATTVGAAAPPAAVATAPAPATPPAASSDMAGMDMSAGVIMTKATGTVIAVSADSVTVDHAPIPEAKWPAMTMAFKASPDLAKTVKAGDKVDFDLKLQGGAGEIMAIRKR